MLDPGSAAAERLAALQVLAHPPRAWWRPGSFAGVASQGPDAPILGDVLRLSPSQADAYSACPRRYALERRLRLTESSSPYAQLGTLVHSVLEAAEREVIGTERRHADLPDALGHLERIWATADFGTPQLNAAWLEHAREAITRLYESWPSDGVPVDLERRVETIIGDVEWVGFIDRLERTPRGLKVIDYKTTKSPPTIDEAKRSIQLGFYATAVAEEFSEPVEGAEMWFPRKEAKSVTKRSLDGDLLGEVREVMEQVTLSIRGEHWEPKVSNRCEKCDFRLSCPAWPEGRGAYLP
jgi:RecB family exonuclease